MVTKDEVAARVEEARRWVASGDELAVTTSDRVIAALADERDELRAELAAGNERLRRVQELLDGEATERERLAALLTKSKEGR